MKVGVIGSGYWGSKHVAEYIELGHDVIAADLVEENRENAEEKGAKTVEDYKELLKDPEVTAVSICTPNATHYPLAMECLNAGKHVLVEKPLAQTAEQGEELLALAKKKDRVLVVGHVFRFNNAINKVKELYESGELGDIRVLKIKWSNNEYANQPDFYTRVGDRNVIWDLAPHAFDIVNYLLKKNPEEISCIGSAYNTQDLVEAAFVNCRLGKTLITMEFSWITPPKTRSLTVVGSKKTAHVECIPQTIALYEDGEAQPLEVEANNTIQTELAAFLDYAQNPEKGSVADGQVGVDTTRMLEKADQSLKEQRTIQLL